MYRQSYLLLPAVSAATWLHFKHLHLSAPTSPHILPSVLQEPFDVFTYSIFSASNWDTTNNKCTALTVWHLITIDQDGKQRKSFQNMKITFLSIQSLTEKRRRKTIGQLLKEPVSSQPQDQAISSQQVEKYGCQIVKLNRLFAEGMSNPPHRCQCDKDATRTNTDGGYSFAGHQVSFCTFHPGGKACFWREAEGDGPNPQPAYFGVHILAGVFRS